jgi:hypothetical protein
MVDPRTHKKVTGLLLHFNDSTKIASFNLFLDIIALLHTHKIILTCAPSFDKAVGIKSLRTAIEQKKPLDSFKKIAPDAAAAFSTTASSSYLYKPYPK